MNDVELLRAAEEMVEPALAEALDRIGEALVEDGPPEGHAVPQRLLGAMRYAVFSPGKRLRPALVLGSARAVHARLEDVLPAACAVEMIHAYSLVHDDLPILDDDDFRRGQPSCHRKFDEPTALLAGDALLTEALALVALGRPLGRGHEVRPERRARATAELARAIGAAGMVGGQLDDILSASAVAVSAAQMRSIHRRKTGRLIQASAVLGAIYGGATDDAVESLRRFGSEVGLAFQLIDDVLDQDGVAAIEGEAAAREAAKAATERALAELARFGAGADPLIQLARAMVERER